MTRRRRDYRIWYVLLAVFIMVFLFSFLSHRFDKSEKEVGAASLVNFDPGYIISDWQMGNYHSMSEADIQAFLKSKNTCYDTNIGKYTAGEKVGYFSETSPPRTWHVTNGHFVCMADEIFDGGTAAHIIYRAAQDYRINPQVLIVLLEKEQSLITDSFPHSQQYRSATGYGCPDTAPCSSQYYGLQNQIRKAAELFRTVLDGGWTNYPLGDNYVQYNPNSACGGSVVNIRSLATSALYRYTPYQPNAAVLSGGSDGCGAYGNMNFYKLFEDWFGGITSGKDGRIEIKKYANDNQEKIGDAVTDIICGLSNGGCYQVFDGGYVYWSLNSDAHLISGEIFNRWFKTGTEWGLLKYPMSDQEKTTNGGFRQKFQTGNIYWTEATGAWDVSGGIYQTYLNNGTEWGVLGYPTSSEMKDEKGVVYQTFEHGAIFWDPATGGTVRIQ